MSRKLSATVFIALWGLLGLAEWVRDGLPIYHGSSVGIGQNIAILALACMFVYGTYATVLILREKRRIALQKPPEEPSLPVQFESLTSLEPRPEGKSNLLP